MLEIITMLLDSKKAIIICLWLLWIFTLPCLETWLSQCHSVLLVSEVCQSLHNAPSEDDCLQAPQHLKIMNEFKKILGDKLPFWICHCHWTTTGGRQWSTLLKEVSSHLLTVALLKQGETIHKDRKYQGVEVESVTLVSSATCVVQSHPICVT